MLYQTILNIILIFSAAIAVIVVSKKLKIPAVIGFILTGLIWSAIAPAALKTGSDLRLLSDFGIVFLLFMVGLEFSPEKVKRLGRTMLIGGSVQIVLTVGVVLLFGLLGIVPFAEALLIAFIVNQSSTAIALKVYQDRDEIDSPHAETSVGIALDRKSVV
jgi:monovalent cation:H+ antiporter-2, CPA2 family